MIVCFVDSCSTDTIYGYRNCNREAYKYILTIREYASGYSQCTADYEGNDKFEFLCKFDRCIIKFDTMEIPRNFLNCLISGMLL
jgi:hypothetical protein